MELERDVPGPRHLQDGGGALAGEGDLRVRIVVGDPEARVPRQVDSRSQLLHSGDGPGRVVGVVQIEELRVRREYIPVGEPTRVGPQRQGRGTHPGETHRGRVGGVPRVGDDHPVARVEDRPGERGEPLLRADEDADLALGVDRDAEPPPDPLGDRLAEPRLAVRGGIAVSVRRAHRGESGGDQRLGRPQVGVPDREPQHPSVRVGPPRLLLELPERVRGKSLEDPRCPGHGREPARGASSSGSTREVRWDACPRDDLLEPFRRPDDVRLAVPDEQFRRAGPGVVLARHREPVGSRVRDRDHIPDREARQRASEGEHVGVLADRADDGNRRPGRSGRAERLDRMVRLVERGPQ